VQGLGRTLETIERETGKRKRKWTNTRSKEKTNYLERVLQIPQLTRGVFFRSFSGTRDYTELTPLTIAQAILERASGDYQTYITIDGLNEKERNRVAKELRVRGIERRKLRGGRDESSELLRLADAMAGFIRDYEDGKPYAQDLYRRFANRNIITQLST